MTELSHEDINFILESLQYTKRAFENYTQYPDYEFKLMRLRDCQKVIDNVRAYRDRKYPKVKKAK